jgi:hypothetical protein
VYFQIYNKLQDLHFHSKGDKSIYKKMGKKWWNKMVKCVNKHYNPC